MGPVNSSEHGFVACVKREDNQDPVPGRKVLAVRIRAETESGNGMPMERVIEIPMNMF